MDTTSEAGIASTGIVPGTYPDGMFQIMAVVRKKMARKRIRTAQAKKMTPMARTGFFPLIHAVSGKAGS